MEKTTIITALIPIVLGSIIFGMKKISGIYRLGRLVLATAVISSITTLIGLLFRTNAETLLLNLDSLGVSFRLDTLSTTMFLMVSIIGFVVVKFSKNYLDGEPGQLLFFRRLMLTVALVQLLVISNSLITLFVTWVATSLSLQTLINHYKERKETQLAVRKKFIVARISDFALLVAMVLIYFEFDSSNFEVIFSQLKNTGLSDYSIKLELAGLFLAIAAIIKSVQIPFHGWLLDVMEAPTPVSALLHAGLLNAGPFLIIRFAYLLDMTTIGSIVIVIIGGASALYGTLVFPTQPSIKTSLAYSSIGHMGFSLMLCGMGLYAASLLHLIAHSFYKAHSFLSSGSAIDNYRLNLLNGGQHLKGSLWTILTGVLLTGIIFSGIVYLWGEQLNFQLTMLGVIIVLGVASYNHTSFTLKKGSINLIYKSVGISAAVLCSFFLLESAVAGLISAQIPSVSDPALPIRILAILIVGLAGITLLTPIVMGNFENNMTHKWKVYKRNGFYIHLLFDRVLIKSKVQK